VRGLLYNNGISTLLWWRSLEVPVTPRAKSAVALLAVGSPKWDRSRGQEPNKDRCLGNGNSNTNSCDYWSSNISNNLKHRETDARDGSQLCSNMRGQRGLNSCSTAMRKANGATTTVYLFLDSLFPKAETNLRW